MLPGGERQARRDRHREYAEDLLAQQRQRRSAFVPLGITLTGSLIAAVVGIVGASTQTQTLGAIVGAIGLGFLAIQLYNQWKEARARLITAALRAEMLRAREGREMIEGRDVEELVRDVQRRTGENWDVIWEYLPEVLAEEDIAIGITGSPRATDRTPLATLRQHGAALLAAGLASLLIYGFVSSGPWPAFLGWADSNRSVLWLPPFSIRGLLAVLSAALATQLVLRLAYPDVLPKPATIQRVHPDGSLGSEFQTLARQSGKRVLLALAIEPIVAIAFLAFILITGTSGGSAPSTIFLTMYVAASVFAFAVLDGANLRAIGDQVPEVIRQLGEGTPPRISMRRLADELRGLTGSSFDASGVAASLLKRRGMDARFWLIDQ